MSGLWPILGIAPTDDRAAIRKAYAEQLKQIDPDTDPDAFMRLREARDWALAGADVQVLEPSLDPVGAATPDMPADPEIDVEEEQRAQAFNLMHLLLLPETGDASPLTPDEENLLIDCLNVLLADPRFEDIGFYAEAEQWFADRIARAIPRSDALIHPASAFFRWDEQDHVTQNAAILHILDRAQTIRFWNAVRVKGHRFHKAWRELTAPAREGSLRGWVSLRQVNQLLTLVRTRYPSLEAKFDWYRVSMWEERPLPSRLGRVGRIAVSIALIIGILLVGRLIAPQPQTAPRGYPAASGLTTFQNAPEDIDHALLDLHLYRSDFNAVAINGANPSLFALFRREWEQARNLNESEAAFARRTGELIDTLYRGAMRDAGYALSRQRAELHRAEIMAARARGWDACDALIRGKEPSEPIATPVTDKLRREHVTNAVLHAALPAAMSMPDEGQRTYRVSGETIGRIAARTGLSESEVRTAMQDGGTPEARCRVNLELLNVAIDMPRKQAMTLLPYL